jgi:hypothetical protein
MQGVDERREAHEQHKQFVQDTKAVERNELWANPAVRQTMMKNNITD